MTLIQDRIEQAAQQAAHRVLVQAVANVGECTYALHHKRFEEAVSELARFFQDYCILDTEVDDDLWRLKHRLFKDVVHQYQCSYRQPCLICDTCRGRYKTWLGYPGYYVDYDFENFLAHLNIDLVSSLRTPIWDTSIEVPEWMYGWTHQTFWEPGLRSIFWEQSTPA